MFARFTDDARAIVVEAQIEARRLHHGWIGCEHLLLALVRRPSLVADAFAEHGVTSTTVERSIDELLPTVVTDEEALASIGIDLDEVRAQVETTFGPGALDRATLTKARWRLRVRRRRNDACRDLSTRRFLAPAGAIPFTPRAKRCLEIAAKAAAPELVRPRHLGLALVALSDTVAGEVLHRLGTDVAALEAKLADSPTLP